MQDIITLARAYRQFLVELGAEFKRVRDEEHYKGFADTFLDAVKSPEVGFTVGEVNNLIKISEVFGLLDIDDLPNHHAMKIIANRKVDMELLTDANSLSVSDFKELIKDRELGSQQRTYRYEVVKRTVETGNIAKVYGEELEEAIKQIKNE